MNVNHYTPIRFSKRTTNFSHLITTHLEPLLLSLLILTGIIGSIYLFGQQLSGSDSSQVSTINNGPEKSSLASILFASPDEDGSNKFDDYVKMESKVDAGTRFNFEFLEDPKASRYVMEMGDGVRLIVTQKSLQYKYEQPGKYVIELKELKSGLLQLIGTKTIKVK